MITSKTSFLALIGNPVSQSLSPIIQNEAIKYLGLDLIYIAIPCKSEDLELVLNSLKKINCKGLNITIPHKQKVFDLCSEVSQVAKSLKAINTLKLNHNKEWIATNTDVEGFIYPLKSLNFKKKKSIVLGTGGASRSVIQGLINLNFTEITVISQNPDSLTKLKSDFKNKIHLQGLLHDDKQIIDLIKESDLIINTTPVGMRKNDLCENLLPYGKNFWQSLKSQTVVYDLIYNPAQTPLLKFCKMKGCFTINGIEMLIVQGAKSLSFWTDGLEVPYEVMHNALKKYFSQN